MCAIGNPVGPNNDLVFCNNNNCPPRASGVHHHVVISSIFTEMLKNIQLVHLILR